MAAVSSPSMSAPLDFLNEAALPEVAKVGGATSTEIAQVLPPVDELLP
jgi:hypothetical protein